jgi:hypothetical protein
MTNHKTDLPQIAAASISYQLQADIDWVVDIAKMR